MIRGKIFGSKKLACAISVALVVGMSITGFSIANTTADAENPSSISLSHVSIEASHGEDAMSELEVGVPSERTYTITNTGEDAFIRLSSSLTFGELAHANLIDVHDAVVEEPPTSEDDETDPADDAMKEDGQDEGSIDTYADESSSETEDPEDAVKDDDSADEGDDIESGENAGEGSENDADTDALDSWTLAEDGFFYRSEPLAANETIEIVVTIMIPYEAEWIEALTDGEPSSAIESIDIDAVQARAVDLDLEANDPWGDVEVEREDAFTFAVSGSDDDPDDADTSDEEPARNDGSDPHNGADDSDGDDEMTV